eukprot:ANDGO_07250.mRNA.1 hypothetical protein
MASSTPWTASELKAAFQANVKPFSTYFEEQYDTVFKDAVHALYSISPGPSDALLDMDDREKSVKRWMKRIVLNEQYPDAIPRFHAFLSRYPAVLATVNTILFPPAASIPTRAASQAPTVHGTASTSQTLRPQDASFSIAHLPSREQFLQIYHENASSIHGYLVQQDQMMKDAVASLPIAHSKGWTSVLAHKLGESPPQAAQWFVNNCVSISDQSLREFWRFLDNQGSGILDEFIQLLDNLSSFQRIP